ncbi:unnamed protein product, partial [Mesorhabditis belari]|uniref:Uncharacterized protein n=1 Tax=Mesorhabditis belari TaxID=2138241 RepID=A0AAF3J6M2_9BILA
MDRNSQDTHIENLRVQVSKNRDNIPGLKLTIDKTWDGNTIGHRPTDIHLGWKFEKIPNRPHKRVVTVEFTTPFYDDPEPEMMPGVTPGLWDYEVLELFFANDNNQYLEVEVSPHGHWLCLLFDGVRTCFNNGEELELTVQNQWVGGDVWKGNIEIPLAYFPANVTKMNAYTIHGIGEDRVYEAMRPVTDGTHEEPDFHRLEFFRRIDRQKFIPPPYGTSPFKDWKYGDLWEGHY